MGWTERLRKAALHGLRKEVRGSPVHSGGPAKARGQMTWSSLVDTSDTGRSPTS